MKDKTWQPLDGGKSKKSNPRPSRPKQNALKIKNTSNIQTIELNIFNKFYQKESLEIYIYIEDEQLVRYFLFQFQFHIVIKHGLEGSIAFHK